VNECSARLRRLWLCWAVLWLLVPLAPAFAAGNPGLRPALARALGARGLRGAQVSALVVRLSDGAVLYEHSPDTPLTPASNMKILTATAALAEFGPAHRFSTRVSADARPDARGSLGTLGIRGGGDPALTGEEWWRLAADLRRAGVREIRDGLVLDDSAFDRTRWHPSWKGVGTRAYHPPIGALTANYGTFAVAIEPGASRGTAARVAIDPALPYLRLEGRVTTAPSTQRSSVRIERRAAANAERIVVSGTVPAGDPLELHYRSVADPTAYAGAVLRMQLEANGIRLGSGKRLGTVPPGWVELMTFRGKTLGEIVRLMMKYSNNGIAESLIKSMGAERFGEPGTWEKGIAALRQRLAALGLRADGARLVDGSGLSRENRVSARLLVDTLRLARRSFAFGPELVSSLPIAATDGTLEHRGMSVAGSVRAKTGLLSSATGLSGYARMRDGTEAVFSVLANEYRHGAADAMLAIDAFVREIVRHDGGPAAGGP